MAPTFDKKILRKKSCTHTFQRCGRIAINMSFGPFIAHLHELTILNCFALFTFLTFN